MYCHMRNPVLPLFLNSKNNVKVFFVKKFVTTIFFIDNFIYPI